MTHVGDQLDKDAGELRVKARKARRDDVARDAFRAGDAHDAIELLVAIADAAPEAERLRLEDLGLVAHLLARKREYISLGRAVQQPDAEFRLERRHATTDGRGGHLEVLGSRGELSVPRHRQKVAQVVPVSIAERPSVFAFPVSKNAR